MPWDWACSHRTKDVLHAEEPVVLTGSEHVAQHVVAMLPVSAKGIAVGIDTAQVGQVDVIDSIVLCWHQAEFTRHLVCQEQGLIASLCVCESVGGDGYRHHHHQGHHLLHNLNILNVRHLFLNHTAKVRTI